MTGQKNSKRHQHGGNIYSYLSLNPELIDFSANINPLGMPPRVKTIIRENLSDLVSYPEPQSLSLRKALAAKYQLKTDNILMGNVNSSIKSITEM